MQVEEGPNIEVRFRQWWLESDPPLKRVGSKIVNQQIKLLAEFLLRIFFLGVGSDFQNQNPFLKNQTQNGVLCFINIWSQNWIQI
jgi:hypothetical protein